MPDGALSITERAVEQFTEQYLSALDAEITVDGDRRHVSLPSRIDTPLELDGATLLFGSDSGEPENGEIPVHPESQFVQEMLAEAKEKQTIGFAAFTTENTKLALPSWITAGEFTTESSDFAPYYDREALCVFFDIGIETVSEYQHELLRPIAVDLGTNEILGGLAETYLKATALDNSQFQSVAGSNGAESIDTALATAREAIEQEIAPIVTETREKASRAADVELNEYRQLQEQRIDELTEEISTLEEQISRLSGIIEQTDEHEERVEALRERKWVRHKRDEFEEEQTELTTTRDEGFPEKHQEVYDRHSLTVTIEPASLTIISFEKGEIDITVRNETHSRSLRLPYGTGVGITEEQQCEHCGEALDADNPASLSSSGLTGQNCCE